MATAADKIDAAIMFISNSVHVHTHSDCVLYAGVKLSLLCMSALCQSDTFQPLLPFPLNNLNSRCRVSVFSVFFWKKAHKQTSKSQTRERRKIKCLEHSEWTSWGVIYINMQCCLLITQGEVQLLPLLFTHIQTTLPLSKPFIPIKCLLHVQAHHDLITLFSVHVNSGFGIFSCEGFDQI